MLLKHLKQLKKARLNKIQNKKLLLEAINLKEYFCLLDIYNSVFVVNHDYVAHFIEQTAY